jgi:transposase
MLHLSSSIRYYLYRSPTDMRKGFDNLAGMVASSMQGNACSGDIFIFLNRNRTHVKLLLWEGDGFSLYYKRLEQGTYELPLCSNPDTTMAITAQQLQFILQGVALAKIEYRKRYKKTAQGY